MSVRHYILATAGHVDHGKSTLVHALTGTDPDRLPEEKSRGITIELGFARLILPAPGDPDSTLDIGVVDVPGHEDFIKNMVAGVGSIDLALLVVATDDGWMPQTEEHVQILEYLGVSRAVIAMTKCDLAEAHSERVDAIRFELRGTSFAESPIIPVSVMSGEGLAALRVAIADILQGIPPAPDLGKPRLPVDRAFVLPGIGTIVTGTLSGGSLHRNQFITVQPTGRTARIRNVQNHGEEVECALPGTRTALNLPDLPLAGSSSEGVSRGHVVTLESLGPAVRILDVELRRSGRIKHLAKLASRPLKHGTRVRVHQGSSNAPAHVHLPDALEPGRRCLARLHLEEPLFLLPGDRFLLRDWPEQATLAGGIVLDVDVSQEKFRSSAHEKLLSQRAGNPASAVDWFGAQLTRDRFLPQAAHLIRNRFSPGEVESALCHLVQSGRAVDLGGPLAESSWWNHLKARALQRIAETHAEHPEQLGLDLAELRCLLEKELPDASTFDALINELSRKEVARHHNIVRLRDHRPALPGHLQEAGHRIRHALSARPFEPPARKELAGDTTSQQALRYLLDSGEAVAVSGDLVMLNSSLEHARALLRQHLTHHGSSTASTLRLALGTNRRVIIPLLEFLDREGFTRRNGDVRSLAPARKS